MPRSADSPVEIDSFLHIGKAERVASRHEPEANEFFRAGGADARQTFQQVAEATWRGFGNILHVRRLIQATHSGYREPGREASSPFRWSSL